MCWYGQQSAAYEDLFQSSKHVFSLSWPTRVLYCVSLNFFTEPLLRSLCPVSTQVSVAFKVSHTSYGMIHILPIPTQL